MAQQQENNNPVKDVVKNVGTKVASGAAQSVGIPKPLADIGAKAAVNLSEKVPGSLMNTMGKMGSTGNSYKNGFGGASNLNQQNNIGKGSHPSQLPNNPGNSQGSGTKNQNQEKSASEQLKDTAKQTAGMAMGLKPKPPEDAPASVKVAYKAEKWAKILNFIAPALPFIGIFFLIILVVIIVMAQVMLMRDKVNSAMIQVTTGVEKYINFASGHGWKTEEELFYTNLEEKYNEAVTLPTEDGKTLYLDVPLIAATVNYSKISDVGKYEELETEDGSELGKQEDGSAEGIFGDYFGSYMQVNQMRNFYYVANDKLGNYKSLLPGNRRLLGHMIGYKIVWKDLSYLTDAGTIISQWGEFAGFTLDSISNDYEQIFGSKLNGLDFVPGVGGIKRAYGAMKLLKKVMAYNSMGENHDDYFKYQMRTFAYEIEELQVKSKQFAESDLASNINENETDDNIIIEFLKSITSIPTPYVYFYDTSDNEEEYHYGHYLKEVYLPGTFFSKENYIPTRVEMMTREIYQQREYYEYLVGDLGSGGNQSVNCDDCSYDLSNVNLGNGTRSTGEEFSNISDIKVKLLGWYDEKGKVLDENIPFEKYILGVVYAEVGASAHPETLKAEAVAARSYSLTRPFAMGNGEYTNFSKQGESWVLTLRGSTADQVYCDPDEGCSAIKKNFNDADMYKGENTKPHTYKKPLSSNSEGENVKSAVEATAGQVATDAEGNVVLTPYLNTDQMKWEEMAKSGQAYTNIIPSHYTSKLGFTVSMGEGKCSTSSDDACLGTTGEWANWRQFDDEWGGILIGSSTIAQVGCTATAITMQVARTGAKTTFSPVNPGTFVNAMKAVGGFTGNSIYWGKVTEVVPDFQYVGKASLTGDSNSKYNTVKKYFDEGYIIVMEVKQGNNSGQHWVAVVGTENGKIIMADPASADTDAIATYGAGLSEIAYYKMSG